MSLTRAQEPGLPRAYGKYELLEQVGRGGMAEVFKARLPGIAGFEKTLVIKRLQPRFTTSQGFVQMFIDEAKLAAQVQHQNIVQVFELGSLDNGELFIVMEYIDGVDLKDLTTAARRSHQRLPVWFALHTAVEVLDALAYAHDLVDDNGRRRNVVHNDVTPENIFISVGGDIKLGDFGVAHDDSRISDPFPGQMKGKVPYMSPEQLSGIKPDGRSDVFACAIVLWETLTQQSLFHALTQAETMARICSAPRVAPSRFNPAVPPALDEVVMAALEVDRENRTGSARALQSDLLGVLMTMKPRVDSLDVRGVVTPLLSVARNLGAHVEPAETLDLEEEEPAPPVEEDAYTTPKMSQAETAMHLASPSATGDFPAMVEPPGPVDPAPARHPPPRPAPVKGMVQSTGSLRDGFTYTLVKPDQGAAPAVAKDPSHSIADVDDLLRQFLTEKFAVEPPPAPRTSRPVRKILSAARQPSLHDGDALAPAEDSKHSFWVRSAHGGQMGPLSPSALLNHLAGLEYADLLHGLITADQVRWVSTARLLRLLSEDLVRDDMSMGQCTFLGTLKGHSLTAVLGELGRTRATGRLVLTRQDPSGLDRRELHIVQGALTAVSDNAATLSLWEKLLSNPFFTEHHLPESVYTAVRIQRPVEALLSGEARAGLSQARALLARRQLRELFAWDTGSFGFDPEAQPLTGRATPLLRLLPRMVSRTHSSARLRGAVRPFMDVPLVRTADFEAQVEAMEFHHSELERIEPLGHGYTLGESLAQAAPAQDDKYALVISHVLIELGLLKPER